MSTIEDISSWVLTDYLNRTNDTGLQTVCRKAAVRAYRLVCAKVPFDELMTTSSELALVSGTDTYTIDSGGWALTPDLRALASVRATFSSTQKRRLRRSHARNFDAMSYSTSGKPFMYARWGNQLILNPTPDSSSYTIRLRYWSRPTIDSTIQNTVLVTPIEWDSLIQWETAFEVLYDLDQIDKAMTLVTPGQDGGSSHKKQMFEVGILPRLWNDLLHTVSAEEGVDEDFSINPVVRGYSLRNA